MLIDITHFVAAYYIEKYASALHSKTKERVLSKLREKYGRLISLF